MARVTIEQMREAILNVPDYSHHLSWRMKVHSMKPDQVKAVYKRFNEAGKLSNCHKKDSYYQITLWDLMGGDTNVTTDASSNSIVHSNTSEN